MSNNDILTGAQSETGTSNLRPVQPSCSYSRVFIGVMRENPLELSLEDDAYYKKVVLIFDLLIELSLREAFKKKIGEKVQTKLFR